MNPLKSITQRAFVTQRRMKQSDIYGCFFLFDGRNALGNVTTGARFELLSVFRFGQPRPKPVLTHSAQNAVI
jgi:hypothetical protein